MSITGIDTDTSETDFEYDDDMERMFCEQEKISLWKAQFQHLLEFSEDILPTALYTPMKWCHVSIRDSLKHVAKTEEIVHNMGTDTRILEVQLEAWKDFCQTSTSKSRLVYSTHLYRRAGDILYFAFYQNRGIAPELREQLDALFQAEFGSTRLHLARSLLKFHWRQFQQIEDFLSLMPEIYRSEVLAGLISEYLNPLARDEKGVVEEKINQLLSSPDYHENQIVLMLLTVESCVFKQAILDSMLRFMITQPSVNAPSTSTTLGMMNPNSSSSSEDIIRSRLKLFVDAKPDLLVKACLATQDLPTTLFDIIVLGLDKISVKITHNRSKIFQDFRPSLFGGDDPRLSLPNLYFRFFQQMRIVPSETSLLSRLTTALRKFQREKCTNTDFWIELFALLNDRKSNSNFGSFQHYCPTYRDTHYDLLLGTL